MTLDLGLTSWNTITNNYCKVYTIIELVHEKYVKPTTILHSSSSFPANCNISITKLHIGSYFTVAPTKQHHEQSETTNSAGLPMKEAGTGKLVHT